MKVFKVNFLQASKTKANGTKLVMCRFGYGNDVQDLNTSISCLPSEWNSATQKVINHASSTDYNNIIDSLKVDLVKIDASAILSGIKNVDSKYIKSIHLGTDRKEYGIITLWNGKLDTVKSVVASGRNTVGSINAERTQKRRLERYLTGSLSIVDILISKIDVEFCQKFYDFLRSIVQDEPARMTFARFKMILQKQVDFGNLTKNPANLIKVFRGKPKKFVWLNLSEVEKLVNLPLVGLAESTERDRICLQCYTGASHSDLEKISLKDVQTDHNGDEFLIIHRKKTDELCSIPLHPEAKKILQKYKNGYIPSISTQNRNTHLLQICQRAGITKKVTTHVGRHTFAMLARHEWDIPLDIVQAIMGHATSKTTERYYLQMQAETVNTAFFKGIKKGKKAISSKFNHKKVPK